MKLVPTMLGIEERVECVIKADDGNMYVNVKGTILYQEKEIEALIQYKVNGDTFEFNALEFNEIPQNMFMYSGLINKMYEK